VLYFTTLAPVHSGIPGIHRRLSKRLFILIQLSKTSIYSIRHCAKPVAGRSARRVRTNEVRLYCTYKFHRVRRSRTTESFRICVQ
jgi:hypothetical protein